MGPTFEAGKPKTLFRKRWKSTSYSPFDVSPDGQRFLINTQAEGKASDLGARVVLNWTQALEP